MRAGNVVLALLTGLLLLVVACAWAVPPMMDWSRFRGSAEALASARLGRAVVISGPISLSLLPRPVLNAEGVSIANLAPGGGSFGVQGLRMQVAFAPLLAGRIDARNLVLRRPALRLPWPVPASFLAARPLHWPEGFTARIDSGSLLLGDLAIDGINATLGTDDAGTISAAGTIKAGSQNWQVATRLGSQDRNGAAALTLALDGYAGLAGAGAMISGQLAADGAFDGRITMRGPDLSRLLPAPGVPFEASGRFRTEEGAIRASDLLIDLGGSAARGAVSLRIAPVTRLEVRLNANRLDLNAWLPTLLPKHGGDLPLALDVSAEAAAFAGGLLRDVHAVLDVAPEGMAVRSAAATLPGDARLQASGEAAGAQSFKGHVSIDAPDVRATLLWLQAARTGVPAVWTLPGWRSAVLAGDVTAAPDRLVIDKIAGSLDTAAVSGSLAFGTGPRPLVTADLDFGRLDADAWEAAFPLALGDLFTAMRQGDAEVSLHARDLLWHGRTLRDGLLAATLHDGHLDLRSLAATLEGVHARLSGSVDANAPQTDLALVAATDDARPLGRWIGQEGLELWRGPLTVQGSAKGPPDALALRMSASVADGQGEATPTVNLSTGRWQGAFTLRHPSARRFLRASGIGRRLGVASGGEWLGEGSLALVAQMSGEPGRVSADTLDLTAGSLRTGGSLTWTTGGDGPLLAGKLSAETLPLPSFDPHSEEPLPLAALTGWAASVQLSAATVLGDLTPVARDSTMTLRLSGGSLRFEQARAGFHGGDITGNATFDAAARPPSAALHLGWSGLVLAPSDGLPLLPSGIADGSADLTATGYSPAALLATARGPVGLHVSDGVVSGMDLPFLQASLAEPAIRTGAADLQAEIRRSLGQGTTAFSNLKVSGQMREGTLELSDLRLAATGGEVGGSGEVTLATGELNLALQVHPDLAGDPSIGVRVAGPADTPALYPDYTAVAAWLSDRVPAPGP
ncbi:MAG: AsmA family protein [Acetobacteraceae bacterium]|nr:AsmA family protein [Acetobacteraceae bacterium]